MYLLYVICYRCVCAHFYLLLCDGLFVIFVHIHISFLWSHHLNKYLARPCSVFQMIIFLFFFHSFSFYSMSLYSNCVSFIHRSNSTLCEFLLRIVCMYVKCVCVCESMSVLRLVHVFFFPSSRRSKKKELTTAQNQI